MSTANTFANWISTAIDKDAYVIATGIMNLTVDPHIVELQPTLNGNALPVIHVESMYAFEEPLAYFRKPFAVKSGATMKIEYTGTVAQTELLGLLGFTVAKKSFLITQ